MQKRQSADLVRTEQKLLDILKQFFAQDIPAPNPNSETDGWASLGGHLEWRLLPDLLRLAPAWPHLLVWCDGVKFFEGHSKLHNSLHGMACSWWKPTDQDCQGVADTGGIADTELIEVEMRLLEDAPEAHVDYLIKLWANGLCHFLTPTKISVLPSCSDAASTPDLACILNAVKKSPGVNRSLSSLLGGFGAQGIAVLDELLSDPNAFVRSATVDGLMRSGVPAHAAMSLLDKALNDDDLLVKHVAVNELWRRLKTDQAFLPLLHQATPVLLAIFGHEPEVHRRWDNYDALAFLVQSEPSVEKAMIGFLADEKMRYRASGVLLRVNLPSTQMLDIYQAALHSENICWRIRAAFCLWYFGVDNGKAFIDVTEDSDCLQEPGKIAWELRDCCNPAADRLIPINLAVPVLSSILNRNKTHAYVWWTAVAELARVAPQSVDASVHEVLLSIVPTLQAHLKDKTDEVNRRCALEALELIGADVDALVQDLIGILYDLESDYFLRKAAVKALVKLMKPDARTIIPLYHFMRQQDSVDTDAYTSDALALLKLLGDSAIPVLLNDFQTNAIESVELAYKIIDLLPELGPAAIPALAELSLHDDLRGSAIIALGEIPDPAGVPHLLPFLCDENYVYRYYAAYSLGQLGVLACEAIPALAEAINDPDLTVCAWAIEALGNMGKAALPVLLAALDSEDEFVLGWTAKALGDVGDSSAKPGLDRLMQHHDLSIRFLAAEALRKIGSNEQ